ncbi:MAG: rubrerythrin [Candidatus Brocadiia bacterium]|nr:MAG: rubrerythrin [Candidatus Brocadiia bacterium]
MDIFEFAMKMEKDGEYYYRRLVEKTENKGIKTILTMLADEEVKHYKAIEQIKTQKPQMADSAILAKSKNIFEQIKRDDDALDLDAGQISLYKKAQNIEKQSQDFYLLKVAVVHEPDHRELFLKLAEEEKKHYFILQHIIDFVSRPQQWLENAEFVHLDEY